jgi:hypothetical protein
MDLNVRQKLPDIRMIIDNNEIFKISICLIFYSLYFSNNLETSKITDFLAMFFQNIYNINVNGLIKFIFTTNSQIDSDKALNYNEILLESVKNKTESKEIEKYYGFDKLTTLLDEEAKAELTSLYCDPKVNLPSNNDNNSEISLTPSLQSQDSGKTYKETIIREEKPNEDEGKVLFYPIKQKLNNLLFGNENCYILVRYIFCIYERLNKVIGFNKFSFMNYRLAMMRYIITI